MPWRDAVLKKGGDGRQASDDLAGRGLSGPGGSDGVTVVVLGVSEGEAARHCV